MRTGATLWSQSDWQGLKKSVTRVALAARSVNAEYFHIRKQIILPLPLEIIRTGATLWSQPDYQGLKKSETRFALADRSINAKLETPNIIIVFVFICRVYFMFCSSMFFQFTSVFPIESLHGVRVCSNLHRHSSKYIYIHTKMLQTCVENKPGEAKL